MKIKIYFKISRLKNIKTDFHGSNNELMLSHASIQILIKIIEIQFKKNKFSIRNNKLFL